MRVLVLGSGSSGNLAIVESEGERLVLDAGMNPTQAAMRMRALGHSLFPKGALGVVVTHQHGDHIAQASPLARALRAPLYMHRGIEASRLRARLDVRDYTPGRPLHIGPFTVDALFVPHDAPQVALRVSAHGASFGLATDLGHVPRTLPDFLGACDLALVEANHCPWMLVDGPYPPRLKERVRGPFGHLGNEQTADLARALEGRRLSRLLLGHVSRTNNTPQRALEVVSGRCRELSVEVVPNGVPRMFETVASRRPPTAFSQLELGFD